MPPACQVVCMAHRTAGRDSRTETSVSCCDGGTLTLPATKQPQNTLGETEQPSETQAETGDVQLHLSRYNFMAAHHCC